MRWVEPSVGALLVLAASSAASAQAAPDTEGATAAAPISCVTAQFALRAYAIAIDSGDRTSGAHDPSRIPRAITPVCRQAIQNGRWPGLAHELLAHAAIDPSIKPMVCEIAPPEALSAIAAWEADDDAARASYDVPCAVTLLRQRPGDFARLVGARLTAHGGCAFPDLAVRLGEALSPDERVSLLPVLDFATRAHALGRDRLYGVLCQSATARAQPACETPATLEPTWAHEARIRRAAPWIGFHVAVAALFMIVTVLLRHRFRARWPAALLCCLLLALIYGVVGTVHAWTRAWDRLC